MKNKIHPKDTKKGPPKKGALGRLFTYTKESCGLLIFGNMFLLITSFCQIILPRIAGNVIDAITKSNSRDELKKFVLYFLIISIV